MKNLKSAAKKVTLFTALLTALIQVNQKPAHAILVGGIPVLGEAALVMFLGGSVYALVDGEASGHVGVRTNGHETVERSSISCTNTFFNFANAPGCAYALLGFVLLDDNSSTGNHFTQISDQDAFKVGLTDAEKNSFNSEVDELNAIGASLGQVYQHDMQQEMSKNLINLELRSTWANDSQSLSSETVSAVKKISDFAASTAN